MAFPSPVSFDPLAPPAFAAAAPFTPTDMTPAPQDANSDPLQNIVPSAYPSEALRPQVVSPLEGPAPMPALDMIVGARVDPTATASQSILSPRTGPGLKLPSFELLGISNAHPPTAAAPRRFSDALPIQHQTQLIETLTPPDEKTSVLWHSLAADSFAAHNSARKISSTLADTSAGDVSLQQTHGPLAGNSTPTMSLAPIPRIELLRTDSDNARGTWLMGPTELIVTNMRLAKNAPTAAKILSHALPCPSPQGFAFPFIISSLQLATPGNPVTWITVFHALPGKISLNDLPTSPPTTPGPSVGGQDYFTSQTFDSAVHVLDYQEELDKVPRTPHPVVPPCTIGVSILERYIPPTSANEFKDMFDANGGRSLLVDRLIELSPDNGTLLFIYPTKDGAQTFMRDYLGPLIDPLLRTMRIVHSLPYELLDNLGNMPAVDSMDDFQVLVTKLNRLLSNLGKDNEPTVRNFSNNITPKFELSLAQKHNVMLDRTVWAEHWWVKQEKTRVRAAVKTYFPYVAARSASDVSDITMTSLVHGVLDGVASRTYPPGREPTVGVEVGVFVIKRTA